MILGTKELSRKDACAGHGAEHAQIEHKQQLVDDGNTAHLQCSHLANHDIVQQRYKVCNAILDNDGQRDAQDTAVKRLVTNISS